MPDPIADVEGQELYDTGLRLARTGDLLRAEQYVKAAMERGYPEERALPSLLKICVAASRLNAALQYAEPHLRDHPANHRLRTLVASIHLGLGNVDDAETHLSEVIEAAPANAPAYYLMGMLRREEHGDTAGSEPYLRRYLELAPNGVHAAEVRNMLRPREPIRRIEHIIDRPAEPEVPEESAEPEPTEPEPEEATPS
jgi:tetratricopeptide (TPR) repeat protein